MPERVSEQTKQRILDAAALRLMDEPVRSLQTRDIAADAGVSTSALYKAYTNKYELFLFAAESVLTEQIAAVIERIDESASPIEIVESFTVDICDVVTKHPYAIGYAFIGLPFLHPRRCRR